MVTRSERRKEASSEAIVCPTPATNSLSEKQLERIETIRKEINMLKSQLDQLLTRLNENRSRD
jgi:hypothetical protein